jgi:hypothetical protein
MPKTHQSRQDIIIKVKMATFQGLNKEIADGLQAAANDLGPEFRNNEGYDLAGGKKVHWSWFGEGHGSWYSVTLYGPSPSSGLRVLGSTVVSADAINWSKVNV